MTICAPNRGGTTLLLAVMLSILSLSVSAEQSYSPYADLDQPTQVYWGDTHVHTSYSSHDANIGGGNRVSPEIAYQFARGEVVEAWNGMPVKLRRPAIDSLGSILGNPSQMGDGCSRLRRGVGAGKHTGISIRRDETEGSLWVYRTPHKPAVLRWMELRGKRCPAS